MSSKIEFRKDNVDYVAILRPSLLAICDRCTGKALLLNQLIYWHGKAVDEVATGKYHFDAPVFFRKQTLLAEEINVERKTVGGYLKEFEGKGWIKIFKNPDKRYKADRKDYYILNSDKIQSLIDAFYTKKEERVSVKHLSFDFEDPKEAKTAAKDQCVKLHIGVRNFTHTMSKFPLTLRKITHGNGDFRTFIKRLDKLERTKVEIDIDPDLIPRIARVNSKTDTIKSYKDSISYKDSSMSFLEKGDEKDSVPQAPLYDKLKYNHDNPDSASWSFTWLKANRAYQISYNKAMYKITKPSLAVFVQEGLDNEEVKVPSDFCIDFYNKLNENGWKDKDGKEIRYWIKVMQSGYKNWLKAMAEKEARAQEPNSETKIEKTEQSIIPIPLKYADAPINNPPSPITNWDFTCPKCKSTVWGGVEKCPECNSVFDWDSVDESKLIIPVTAIVPTHEETTTIQ